MDVGERISRRRRQLGYSRERVIALGNGYLTKNGLDTLETGRKAHITVDELLLLARALRTSPVELLIDIEHPFDKCDYPALAGLTNIEAARFVLTGTMMNKYRPPETSSQLSLLIAYVVRERMIETVEEQYRCTREMNLANALLAIDDPIPQDDDTTNSSEAPLKRLMRMQATTLVDSGEELYRQWADILPADQRKGLRDHIKQERKDHETLYRLAGQTIDVLADEPQETTADIADDHRTDRQRHTRSNVRSSSKAGPVISKNVLAERLQCPIRLIEELQKRGYLPQSDETGLISLVGVRECLKRYPWLSNMNRHLSLRQIRAVGFPYRNIPIGVNKSLDIDPHAKISTLLSAIWCIEGA